jgi:hypothetical protein
VEWDCQFDPSLRPDYNSSAEGLEWMRNAPQERVPIAILPLAVDVHAQAQTAQPYHSRTRKNGRAEKWVTVKPHPRPPHDTLHGRGGSGAWNRRRSAR